MTETHPAVARYLSRLNAELAPLDAGDRREILSEIEHHIADAVSAGRAIDDVLTSLGPADALARAYAVELTLNQRRSAGRIDRALTVIGWLTVASLPSLVISVTLLALGVAFGAAGVAVFVAGIAALVNPAFVPDLTVSPWVCLVIGPPMALGGGAALFGLYLYLRMLVRITVETLHRVRSQTQSA